MQLDSVCLQKEISFVELIINQQRRKQSTTQDFTPQRIGQAMNALGYEQISLRPQGTGQPIKAYHIKFL